VLKILPASQGEVLKNLPLAFSLVSSSLVYGQMTKFLSRIRNKSGVKQEPVPTAPMTDQPRASPAQGESEKQRRKESVSEAETRVGLTIQLQAKILR
jgi:hypothetical protein